MENKGVWPQEESSVPLVLSQNSSPTPCSHFFSPGIQGKKRWPRGSHKSECFLLCAGSYFCCLMVWRPRPGERVWLMEITEQKNQSSTPLLPSTVSMEYLLCAMLKVDLCCLCLYYHCLPGFWRMPACVVFALGKNPPQGISSDAVPRPYSTV